MAEKKEKKLFLLDGMALAYRSHFALVNNPRMTSAGMNTSMVFVFTNTLLEIMTKERPTHLAVVFDTEKPTYRDKMYSEYKANRESMPEDIKAGFPYLDRVLTGFRVPVIRKDGFEADDVIGTLAQSADLDGFTTYMVTPDKDFAQLVTENTLLFKPGRQGSDPEIHGVEEVLEKWGIAKVDQVIDMLGLMGDTSDNIPGVPGIGPKTAQKLIEKFGSIESLLDSTGQLKGKQKENLETFRDQALMSKELVIINTQVPLDVTIDDLVVRDRDEDILKDVFNELEFRNLAQRVFGEAQDAAPPSSGPQQSLSFNVEAAAVAEPVDPQNLKTLADVDHDYTIADADEKLDALIQNLKKQKLVCMDLETSHLSPKSSEIVGIAVSMKVHTGTYIPVPEDRDETLVVLEKLRDIIEDKSIGLVGHNVKYDLSVLKWHGFEWCGPVYDTMLAGHLTQPETRMRMDSLAESLLEYKARSITELIGDKGKEQKSMREVPVEDVAEYAAEDADVTLQLWDKLAPQVEQMGQTEVYEKVELPLLRVLVNMEYEGIRLDTDVLAEISKNLQIEIEETRERIFELAGEEFNLNSPKQLGEIFFEKLQLDPKAKRTRKSKQYQTNERILTRLANKHEIAAKVIHYRESSKLKSTYIDTLPGTVFEQTGRVHTNYEQAVTATGRMQSSNPNLQNIPVRSDQGREIRKAFVARDEHHTLLAADYSQIELRVVADISGDEAMKGAFKRGDDIHDMTSMKVFNVDEDGITAEMRRQAKMVNFGIVFGISAFGLSDRLDIPRAQSLDLIESYFTQYPGIRDYMDNTIEFCREKGYVQTVTGRRRYLRDINSRNKTLRSAAERNAINSPIQGSAADMIKIAMAKIHNRMREADLKSRMLLQVHDELVFDMHKDEADVLPSLVEEEMKTAIPLSVPIAVELGTGDNWLVAH
ncbi:MAG: DNA polymerase I [Candidatus Latescibacterota bacterium]|nr:DNA polymerase I [Candidatus Latescibacterota bacterium]